jgi:hypothetical protein
MATAAEPATYRPARSRRENEARPLQKTRACRGWRRAGLERGLAIFDEEGRKEDGIGLLSSVSRPYPAAEVRARREAAVNAPVLSNSLLK